MSAVPEKAVCSTCGRGFSGGERFCPFDKTDLNPTPSRSPDDPLVGTVLGGSYTLIAKLGGGGMGVVYRARQNRLRRDVALKILSPHLSADEQARERFRTEALAVSQLSNAHTVSIHDFGSTEDGLLYLVMQLLEGESLRARLTRGPLPLHLAVSIAAQICESLAEAHDRMPQIVHRDIKPDNVIVRRMPDGEELVTVLDFGLAKLAGADRLTLSGLIVGTPAYMAPEQARNDGTLDARVDLYSLGVVLHEMISGRQPFVAPNPTALLYKHVWEPAPTLSAVCPGLRIPHELERFVLDLLAKNPDERVPTASVARSRLLEILRNLPPDDLSASLVLTVQSPIASPVGSRPPMMAPMPVPATPSPTLETTSEPGESTAPVVGEPSWELPVRPRRAGWIVPLLVGVAIIAVVAAVLLSHGTGEHQIEIVAAPVALPVPPPPAPVPVPPPPAPAPVVPVAAPAPAPVVVPPEPAHKKHHRGEGEEFPVVPE